MQESKVEQFFVDAVKKAGGLALKFTSQSMNGVKGSGETDATAAEKAEETADGPGVSGTVC